jgi:hypothetical protein
MSRTAKPIDLKSKFEQIKSLYQIVVSQQPKGSTSFLGSRKFNFYTFESNVLYGHIKGPIKSPEEDRKISEEEFDKEQMEDAIVFMKGLIPSIKNTVDHFVPKKKNQDIAEKMIKDNYEYFLGRMYKKPNFEEKEECLEQLIDNAELVIFPEREPEEVKDSETLPEKESTSPSTLLKADSAQQVKAAVLGIIRDFDIL